MSLRVVLTTFPDRAGATQAARTLVAEGLAACAQVSTSPVQSVWRWDGEVQEGEEWSLALKTIEERVDALRDRMVALHPYELPEFVVLVATSSTAYLDWARDCCSRT